MDTGFGSGKPKMNLVISHILAYYHKEYYHEYKTASTFVEAVKA
jgi:hypothetical protein